MLNFSSGSGHLKSVQSSIVLAFLASSTALIPSIACAQQQVTLQVEGVVVPKCGFDESLATAAGSTPDLVFEIDAEQAGATLQSRKMALALQCNAPFTLAVHASHGGLKHTSVEGGTIGGGFTTHMPYQLAVTMTTDDAATPLMLACPSQDLVSSGTSCTASSGTQAAIARGAGIGEVAVTLIDSAGFPIRGRYQDTIVLALALQ